MRTTAYTRGKYKKQQLKNMKITFLTDKDMKENLKQLSGMKHKGVSQLIREAVEEYYIQTSTASGVNSK